MRRSAGGSREPHEHKLLVEGSHTAAYLLLLLWLLGQCHVGLVKIVAEVPRSVSIHLGSIPHTVMHFINMRGMAP